MKRLVYRTLNLDCGILQSNNSTSNRCISLIRYWKFTNVAVLKNISKGLQPFQELPITRPDIEVITVWKRSKLTFLSRKFFRFFPLFQKVIIFRFLDISSYEMLQYLPHGNTRPSKRFLSLTKNSNLNFNTQQ